MEIEATETKIYHFTGGTYYIRTYGHATKISRYKNYQNDGGPMLVAAGTGARLTNVRRSVALTSALVRDIGYQLGFVQIEGNSNGE